MSTLLSLVLTAACLGIAGGLYAVARFGFRRRFEWRFPKVPKGIAIAVGAIVGSFVFYAVYRVVDDLRKTNLAAAFGFTPFQIENGYVAAGTAALATPALWIVSVLAAALPAALFVTRVILRPRECREPRSSAHWIVPLVVTALFLCASSVWFSSTASNMNETLEGVAVHGPFGAVREYAMDEIEEIVITRFRNRRPTFTIVFTDGYRRSFTTYDDRPWPCIVARFQLIRRLYARDPERVRIGPLVAREEIEPYLEGEAVCVLAG